MRAPASLLHRAALANTGTGEPSSSPASMKAPEQQQQTAPVMAVNSDMVLILASLLCALVCVLGLALVSRCTCRRRRSASYSDHAPPPPKGLKKKAIHALPTVSFAANGASPTPATCSSSECAICLAEFTEGEALRVLPRCGHGFHVACVDAWLRTCATCPFCRAPILATPTQPPATTTVVVVVATNNRCGRCGELAAPTGGGDDTFLP
ncbi:unnamed protein product [Triticum turgidum subsp. durum]|uniref:RING-type domain-containing protein n=1 Tax=Triticum turgidum subsp. durum TaxID=4567 RepID=A0A9R1AD40_TRITD|nr:unnamed protein product [Triticum turgidum subsp. durum]